MKVVAPERAVDSGYIPLPNSISNYWCRNRSNLPSIESIASMFVGKKTSDSSKFNVLNESIKNPKIPTYDGFTRVKLYLFVLISRSLR